MYFAAPGVVRLNAGVRNFWRTAPASFSSKKLR